MNCPFIGDCKKKVSKEHYATHCVMSIEEDPIRLRGFQSCAQYAKNKLKTPANHGKGVKTNV